MPGTVTRTPRDLPPTGPGHAPTNPNAGVPEFPARLREVRGAQCAPTLRDAMRRAMMTRGEATGPSPPAGQSTSEGAGSPLSLSCPVTAPSSAPSTRRACLRRRLLICAAAADSATCTCDLGALYMLLTSANCAYDLGVLYLRCGPDVARCISMADARSALLADATGHVGGL